MTGEPRTLGCDRNFTAFCTCSSRIGSEFTNTDGVEFSLIAPSIADCAPSFSSWIGCGPGVREESYIPLIKRREYLPKKQSRHDRVQIILAFINHKCSNYNVINRLQLP